MKKFRVAVCRVEHNIYLTEVSANNSAEAEEKALDAFTESDDEFAYQDCVHAEEFVQEVQEVR